MTNITALLLVLTLTGAPVASVICVTECQHGPVMSGHCQADMVTSVQLPSASYRCNDPSISNSLYVVEHRAVSGAAVLTSASYLTRPDLVRTDAPAAQETAADAWLKPPLVLRI